MSIVNAYGLFWQHLYITLPFFISLQSQDHIFPELPQKKLPKKWAQNYNFLDNEKAQLILQLPLVL
jgi:hypothetical protein